MSTIPFTYSGKSVTFYVNGNPFQASATTSNFQAVLDELKKADQADPDRLIALVTPATAVASAVAKAEAVAVDSPDYLPAGKVSVTRNEIRFNGEVVGGVLVDRILTMLAEGFDIMPMVRFMENLYMNPADFAREELYLWLEDNNLPITEDGHFLAYKTVRHNFKSHHDGRTDNTPGTIVSMPRQEVDPVRDRTCSRGLHFCSHSYLSHYGTGGTIVMLKINPADVVSIPSDYDNAKGRAWKYLVLNVLGEDPHTKQWPAVVSSNGIPIAPAEPLLEIPSDLSKALFAALGDLNIKSRYSRIAEANLRLGTSISSYHDLTVKQATALLESLRATKADLDAKSLKSVRAARVHAINGFGIETLRREASKAGMVGAWKGPNAAALRQYLISKI